MATYTDVGQIPRQGQITDGEADYRWGDYEGDTFENLGLMGWGFQYSDLRFASFEGCSLQGADFKGCSLTGAKFKGCSLQGANFERANLKVATFEGCSLQGAAFQRALMTGVTLLSVRFPNFEGAKGVGQVYLPEMSSRGAMLTAVMGEDRGITLSTGCFRGSLGDFRRALGERINSPEGRRYLDAAEWLCGALGA